jgi:hypothetical protein
VPVRSTSVVNATVAAPAPKDRAAPERRPEATVVAVDNPATTTDASRRRPTPPRVANGVANMPPIVTAEATNCTFRDRTPQQ